jgi:hypothetical protein
VGGGFIVQQDKISRAEILFQNPKNYSLGMFKNSAIILDAIRRSFLTKSAATAAMCMSTLTIVPVHLYTKTIKLT